mgnify:CR=1 FL=1
MFMPVTEMQFTAIFEGKLNVYYKRALTVFTQYGTLLSWDVANILLHAADKGKVDDTLVELEKHWEEHLQFQHPEIRGTVEDKLLGINKTRIMFLRVCKDVLKLQPA